MKILSASPAITATSSFMRLGISPALRIDWFCNSQTPFSELSHVDGCYRKLICSNNLQDTHDRVSHHACNSARSLFTISNTCYTVAFSLCLSGVIAKSWSCFLLRTRYYARTRSGQMECYFLAKERERVVPRGLISTLEL